MVECTPSKREARPRVSLFVAFIFIAAYLQGVKSEISDRDSKTISNNIDVAQKTVTNGDYLKCWKTIERMVGPAHEDGSLDTEGILSRFSQAYLFNFPAVRAWKEARIYLEKSRGTLIRVRQLQHDWQKLKAYPDKCNDVLSKAGAKISTSTTDSEDAQQQLSKDINACRDDLIISQLGSSNRFQTRMYTSCYESVALVSDAIFFSVTNLWFSPRQPEFQWSLFRSMYAEVQNVDSEIAFRLETSFPEYIAEIRGKGHTEEADELDERLKEIKERLSSDTLPYREIYFGGDMDALDDVRYDPVPGYQKTTWYNFFGAFSSLFEDTTIFKDGVQYFEDDAPSWTKHHLGYWRNNVSYFIADFNDSSFQKIVDRVEEIYTYYLHVDMMPEGQRKSRNDEGIVVGDGEWDWDLNNGIHNMRIGWDLMQGVLEEIKCYMKDTYYFHKREEALRMTQVDLSTATLYSRISHSMQFPCLITNESDIVSNYCDRKNHEICAPMGPLDPRQRTNSEHHGGRTLLRPKWIYQYDPKKKRCWGRKDYVMRHYACRCGFRLDCGNDLGVNITCQLQYNDLLRGQCRGDVGYPCKTLPLAPGKHNETCRSGYCNMYKNSCEDRPYRYSWAENRGRPTTVGLLLMCLAGLFSVLMMGQFIMKKSQLSGVLLF